MSVEITVCFDYVCPFCYLAGNALKKAIAGKDVTIRYIPYELRREPTPKVDPMHDEMRLKRFDEVLLPTAQKLGVEMKLPWISPHPYTTVPLQGFHYVMDSCPQKVGDYNWAIFNAFYIDERDIGEQDVVEEIMQRLEISVEPFRQVIAEGKYSQLLLEEKAYCKETLGVTGIPSYFIKGQKLSGVMDPQALEAAILLAETSQSQQAVDGMVCDENGCGSDVQMHCDENGCGPSAEIHCDENGCGSNVEMHCDENGCGPNVEMHCDENGCGPF